MSDRRKVLSLCMIVKNEEKYLEECLLSVKDIVDELVIVDTGSTDRTIEIAKKYDALLYNFKWANDFSAARNFALKQCTGEWILYLDADERLTKDSLQELSQIIEIKDKTAVFCGVISKDGKGNTSNIMSYVRLFSNSKNIKFTGSVHEQIAPSLKENNYNFIYSGIKILHEGYSISDDKLNEKAKRNLNILLRDFALEPTGYKAYHLGVSYVVLNNFEKAITYFFEAIKDKSLEPNHVSHCFRYLAAYELNITKDLDKALYYAFEGIKSNEKQPLLNIIISSIYLYKGDFKNSEKFCRLAYEYNYSLTRSQSAFFDIIVDEKSILQHILNIAALTANKKLFNDFYDKLNNNEIEENWEKLFLFFNLLFNNKEIPQYLIKGLNVYLKNEYIDSILALLQVYQNISLRIEILKVLEQKFTDKIGIYYLLADYYLNTGDVLSSVKYYQKFYEIDKTNPVVINQLITIFFKLSMFKELSNLLNEAVVIFKDEPEIFDKLNKLKSKISDLIK
jgi:glycosyltransferase involved in cell wall biosynthesis